MDNVTGLIAVLGVIIAIIVIAFVYAIARRAWYSTAAKVMGWDDHEKFMRETQDIERAALRDKRQQEKDATAGGADRRRGGAILVTVALAWVAWQLKMPWWEIVMIIVVACIGLHMVAGVAIRWRA